VVKVTKIITIVFSVIALAAIGIYTQKIPFFDNQILSSPEQVLGTSESIPNKTYPPYWKFDQLEGTQLPSPPVLGATSAIGINLTSNKIFFEKNSSKRSPAASTIKIMTAVLALENKKLDDIVTVTQTAASIEPDSMGLYPGEKLTIKQLVQGLMLVSGNDAAESIAEGVSGNRSEFVELMNQKAKELGMNDTFFVNPSGLEGDGIHFTTPKDMAILSKYALSKSAFREIVSEREILIPYTVNDRENHKNFYLGNTSPLIDYPGYLGIKPGYTPEANKCLVTLVNVENNEILVVVLGSDDRKGDTESLLEYAKTLLINTSKKPFLNVPI